MRISRPGSRYATAAMARPSTRAEHPGATWQKTLRAPQLRRDTTDAELRLWAELRRRALGCRVRRQRVVLGWITDFFVPGARLVIEVDGDVHDRSVDDDRLRTEALEAEGLRVIRFRNEQVVEQLGAVVDVIAAAIEAGVAATLAGRPPRGD